MPSRRERTRPVALLLNSVDLRGRPVDPSVLSVAQEMASRAVAYGERLLGDPALALSLYEEAAATVSKTVAEKKAAGKSDIRDLRNYLFRVYMRRVGTKRKSHLPFDEPHENDKEKQARHTDKNNIERDILLKEVLESCDTLTREIFFLKLEGCNWKEIEKRCGVPVNAASLRFSKAIRQLRRLVRARGR